MKQVYNHIDIKDRDGAEEDFFRQVSIPYEKSREEVWTAMENKLAETPARRISYLNTRRLVYGIAATIILLAGVFSLMRLYTTSVYCPSGQHLSVNLPDGSAVELNAESNLSYKPFWWRFSRELAFEGEGYFEVVKGKKFSVISSSGRTEVLGTSFNIYSRDREYIVTCLTGKVRVISFASAAAVLSPDYTARISDAGDIIISKEPDASESHAWVNDMFSFTSRPLVAVLNEIGRQYGIKITLKAPVDYLYTGYFTKARTVEETLTLVCTPFGLNFARISEKEVEITQN